MQTIPGNGDCLFTGVNQRPQFGDATPQAKVWSWPLAAGRHARAPGPSHHRNPTDVVLGIEPERLGYEAVEDFERQDGFALGGFDFRADGVQAGHADARVEFAGAVFDAVEVVFEPWLADKVVDLAQCGFR